MIIILPSIKNAERLIIDTSCAAAPRCRVRTTRSTEIVERRWPKEHINIIIIIIIIQNNYFVNRLLSREQPRFRRIKYLLGTRSFLYY